MFSYIKSCNAGKTYLRILFFFLLVTQICFAQYTEFEKTDINNIPAPQKFKLTPHIPKESAVLMHPSFYDRKSEWQTIIKEFWGPGESFAGKLATFDAYQNFARAYNSTFLWNPINWDSFASVLRSRITDSTSRGEFARILNDLVFGLRDGHAYAYDNIVLNTALNPGTPFLTDGGYIVNHFGAALTSLEDSSLLVYKVVTPNHPLGLVPGDIILGYQGVPWHQIVQELLQGGVPHNLYFGAAPSTLNRVLLWAAGESWHLFDTIDVVKHSTGQTVHLPLDTMITLNVTGMNINNEQLPIPGVPMPVLDYSAGAVKYGIIQGTNIGYIYVYHHEYQAVSSEFDAAVLALMETDGLIIDIRFDVGGRYGLNNGISRLMNHPTFTMDAKKRCSPNDLYSLCPYYPSFWIGEIPSDIGTYYDKPIAVLLGTNCLSYGDISSWQFSYIPNARMFGRSPMAIYSGMWAITQPSRPGYSLQCPNLTMVDHYAPDLPRWGQEYPFLEQVWLTPDGVANGEDGVVTRALEWMNNLVFSHEVASEKTYYAPGIDSVHFSTIIENPNSHQISARGYLKTLEGALIDSVDLVHQLLNPDGEQWTADFDSPNGEDFYDISVTAFDNTIGDQFATPNAVRFTTAGPLVLDSISYIKVSQVLYNLKPYVTNNGMTKTITGAKLRLVCNDSWLANPVSGYSILPDIAPGQTVGGNYILFRVIDSLFTTGYFNIESDIMINDWLYWEDSTQVVVGVEEENNEIPTEFSLKQNYPNPFNPITKIKYSIPKSSQVILKIFNTLGQEIEILANEEKPVGTYELNWNAANLPSGVYFYQLKAGEFTSVKKMILLK